MSPAQTFIAGAIATTIFIFGAVYFYNQEQNNMKNVDMFSGGGMEVVVTDVSYFGNVQGFFARPKSGGSYPGVVMIHEWWGLNENIKEMAKNLAGEGYAVLAVDLFGTVATTSDEARMLVGNFNKEKGVSNLKAAVVFLRDQGSLKVASLGWCFGGGQSLQLALSGETLDATIVYYGQLVTEKRALQKITWPVLGIFGETDTSIPVSSVDDFKNTLTSLGVQNNIYVYPGVGHAFANPSGANFAPEETKDAWEKTLAFLQNNLK